VAALLLKVASVAALLKLDRLRVSAVSRVKDAAEKSTAASAKVAEAAFTAAMRSEAEISAGSVRNCSLGCVMLSADTPSVASATCLADIAAAKSTAAAPRAGEAGPKEAGLLRGRACDGLRGIKAAAVPAPGSTETVPANSIAATAKAAEADDEEMSKSDAAAAATKPTAAEARAADSLESSLRDTFAVLDAAAVSSTLEITPPSPLVTSCQEHGDELSTDAPAAIVPTAWLAAEKTTLRRSGNLSSS